MAKKKDKDESKIDLNTLLAQINKKYGSGTAGIAASSTGLAVPRISFGVFALDYASGGGVPYGRITGFQGAKSCGKTSNALRVVASSQGYCREHLVQMVPTTEKVYICPECGNQNDVEGEFCSYCDSNGVESAFIDINRYKMVCPECGEYNPMKTSWIDAEGAFVPSWAARFGVDCTQLIITRPESAESAIDIAEGIMQTGEIDITVIDSIAALVPMAEVEGSMEDNNVGLQARLINKMLRKFSSTMNKPGAVSKHRPTVIMINQIRQKVGCFEYDTKVTLEDGSTEKIGKLVCNNYSGKVLSFNPYTQKIEPRKIIAWHKNGKSDSFISFFVKGGNSGYFKFKATEEHKIFTPNGEVEAKELKEGDFVCVKDNSFYSKDQHDLILGSILGDGSLRFLRNSRRGSLRFTHGYKQKEYCSWKAKALSVSSYTCKNGNEYAESLHSEEFNQYKSIKKKKGTIEVPQDFVERINEKVTAIWYMDDGTFGGSYKKWGNGKCSISCKIMTLDSLQRIATKFESLGMGKPFIKEGRGFLWSGEEAHKFQRAISPFIHPSMRYKIKNSSDFEPFSWDVQTKEHEYAIGRAEILKINKCPKNLCRYDITVENNHNYFVGGGVLVHNCMYGSPDTLPGGLGQEFATSLDIKFNPQKLVDDKQGNPQYQISTFRCVKNKCSTPHKASAFRMWLDYDEEGHYPTDTEEYGVVLGLASKAGLFGDSKSGWKLWDKEFKTRKEVVEYVLSDILVFRKLREELLNYRFGNLDTTTGIMNLSDLLNGTDNE